MLKRNCIMEIDDNNLISHSFFLGITTKLYKKDEYNINLLKEGQLNVRGKKASIILEGEKVNIKYMTLPKVKKYQLYNLILEELSCYNKTMEKIYFNFSIVKASDKSLDIIVFYSNEGKIIKLEKYFNKKSCIKRVYLLQFCYLMHYSLKIKHENFILAFVYKGKLYNLCCINKKLIYNNIILIRENNRSIVQGLYEFIESSRINNELTVNDIYLSCIPECIQEEMSSMGYNIINLGNIDDKSIIYSVRRKRG